jgi:hypothetical protein
MRWRRFSVSGALLFNPDWPPPLALPVVAAVKTEFERRPTMNSIFFPRARLALVPTIKLLSKKLYSEGFEDSGRDLVDWFGEWHMESQSEAGYTEMRSHERLSARAFARILRYDSADFKAVADAVGYERGGSEYRELGFATAVSSVLSARKEYALGLKEAMPTYGLPAEGPFGRASTFYVVPRLPHVGHEYQMEVGDLPDTAAEFTHIWLQHMANENSGIRTLADLDERGRSIIDFASIVRVGDTDKLGRLLKKYGLKDFGLTLSIAESIIAGLRVCRPLWYGITSSQYEDEKPQAEASTDEA